MVVLLLVVLLVEFVVVDVVGGGGVGVVGGGLRDVKHQEIFLPFLQFRTWGRLVHTKIPGLGLVS